MYLYRKCVSSCSCLCSSVCAPPCWCVYVFSQTHFGSAMSCQSKSKGSAWRSEVASALSPASPRSSITGERAKMRAEIHKQAGKAFTYMQTSLILFLCDPGPFQNNTDLTRALFVTSPSTSSSRFPFKCFLTYYFYVSTLFLVCLISFSVSHRALCVANSSGSLRRPQSCDSTILSVP